MPPALSVPQLPVRATGKTVPVTKKRIGVAKPHFPQVADKTPETIFREELQKRLEITATWSKVWEIEAATAKLKLSRITSESTEYRQRHRVEMKVARCDLNVKSLEERLCHLKIGEVTKLLQKVRAQEAHALSQKLNKLGSTIKTVQRYPKIIGDPDRQEFFFSDCHQQWGLGKWYCECLDNRPKWTRYPSEKWFVTDSGVQLYSPMGRVPMDFSDQTVYSHSDSSIAKTDCISNKTKLALSAASFLPPTWHINNQKWGDDGGQAPTNVPKEPTVWFLKESTRNFATGIGMFMSPAECFAAAEPGKEYVVQAHYRRPLLVDPVTGLPRAVGGHKFHIRLYMFLYSPPQTDQVRVYTCKGHGWICIAAKPWSSTDTSRDVQITRDRSIGVSWAMWPKVYARMKGKVKGLVESVVDRFKAPPKKTAFELFGLDFILTTDDKLLMYEANAGPCVKDAEKPMLSQMLDICLPWGAPSLDNNVWDEVTLE